MEEVENVNKCTSQTVKVCARRDIDAHLIRVAVLVAWKGLVSAGGQKRRYTPKSRSGLV